LKGLWSKYCLSDGDYDDEDDYYRNNQIIDEIYDDEEFYNNPESELEYGDQLEDVYDDEYTENTIVTEPDYEQNNGLVPNLLRAVGRRRRKLSTVKIYDTLGP